MVFLFSLMLDRKRGAILMQAIKQIIKVPENRELQIRLPVGVAPNETIEVILIYGNTLSENEEKINLLKAAMNDKQFRQDLEAIADDFSPVDADIWEE